jgi:hypothetical protein
MMMLITGEDVKKCALCAKIIAQKTEDNKIVVSYVLIENTETNYDEFWEFTG